MQDDFPAWDTVSDAISNSCSVDFSWWYVPWYEGLAVNTFKYDWLGYLVEGRACIPVGHEA